MTTFTETELRALMAKAVREVRATNPLAPSITNTVTQSFVANAQLAVGGSAAMVYLPDEGEAVAQASGATYINLGTLLPIYEETIPRTAQALAAAGKPWVLDPVGIGIGSLRSQLLRQVQPCKPALVRANASEVIALASLWGLDVDRTAACNDAQPGAADAATDESQTPGSTAAGDTNDKPVSAEAAADAPPAPAAWTLPIPWTPPKRQQRPSLASREAQWPYPAPSTWSPTAPLPCALPAARR